MGEMLSFIQHTWDSGGPSHSICYYSPSTVFRSFSHVTCAPFMVQSVGESNDPDPELSLLGFASDTHNFSQASSTRSSGFMVSVPTRAEHR